MNFVWGQRRDKTVSGTLHCSVTKSSPTLCNPTVCRHQASLSFTIFQSWLKSSHRAHWVSDAVQPSYPVTPFSCSQSSPALGFFSSESSLCIRWPNIEDSTSASVLPTNIHCWFPLGLTGLIFWWSKGLSGVFPSTAVRKHQFFVTRSSLWSNVHICPRLLGKP